VRLGGCGAARKQRSGGARWWSRAASAFGDSRRKEALLTTFIGAGPRVSRWSSILGVRAMGGPRGANPGGARASGRWGRGCGLAHPGRRRRLF